MLIFLLVNQGRLHGKGWLSVDRNLRVWLSWSNLSFLKLRIISFNFCIKWSGWDLSRVKQISPYRFFRFDIVCYTNSCLLLSPCVLSLSISRVEISASFEPHIEQNYRLMLTKNSGFFFFFKKENFKISNMESLSILLALGHNMSQ